MGLHKKLECNSSIVHFLIKGKPLCGLAKRVWMVLEWKNVTCKECLLYGLLGD